MINKIMLISVLVFTINLVALANNSEDSIKQEQVKVKNTFMVQEQNTNQFKNKNIDKFIAGDSSVCDSTNKETENIRERAREQIRNKGVDKNITNTKKRIVK